MSNQELIRQQQVHAFDQAPRREELHDLHVPFDDMTGSHGCEKALTDALTRGERVALVGVSGAGKSSVTATVLGPLVETLVPLPIPVAIEQPEVASNPTAFAGWWRGGWKTHARQSAMLPGRSRTKRHRGRSAVGSDSASLPAGSERRSIWRTSRSR